MPRSPPRSRPWSRRGWPPPHLARGALRGRPGQRHLRAQQGAGRRASRHPLHPPHPGRGQHHRGDPRPLRADERGPRHRRHAGPAAAAPPDRRRAPSSRRSPPPRTPTGSTPSTSAALAAGSGGPVVPGTPLGCMELLRRSGVPMPGAGPWSSAGASSSGGRWRSCSSTPTPPSPSATPRRATWPAVCREADILVAAIGRPGMVTAEYVKPGAAVIDVGHDPRGRAAARRRRPRVGGAGRRVAHAGPRRGRPDDHGDAAAQHPGAGAGPPRRHRPA